MQPYVFFTDSTCDLTPDLVQEMDAHVLPMSFTLDGQSYRNYPDNRELNPHAFYDKLRAGSMSTTSQVAITDYEQAFTPFLEQGQDIFYLAFSSGLSGTYQASKVAIEDLQERYPGRRIVSVDSLQASMGEGLFAYTLAMMRQNGATLDELEAFATQNVQRFCAWFTVDDLMFLARRPFERRGRGGRHAAGHQTGAACGPRRPPGGDGKSARPPRQPGRTGQALCPVGRQKLRRDDGVHQPRRLPGGLPVRRRQDQGLRRQARLHRGYRPRHRRAQRPRHGGAVLCGRPALRPAFARTLFGGSPRGEPLFAQFFAIIYKMFIN